MNYIDLEHLAQSIENNVTALSDYKTLTDQHIEANETNFNTFKNNNETNLAKLNQIIVNGVSINDLNENLQNNINSVINAGIDVERFDQEDLRLETVKADKDSVYTKNDIDLKVSDFYNKNEIDTKISNIEIDGTEVTRIDSDLTSYKTSNDLTIQDIQEQLNNLKQSLLTTYNIVSLESLSDININKDDSISDVLPEQITATLDNDTNALIDVKWNKTIVNKEKNGTYNVSGILKLPSNITNTNNLVPIINVIVSGNDKNVVSVMPINDINVEYNTSWDDILTQLPTTVNVVLDDDTNDTVSVSWNSSSYSSTSTTTQNVTGSLVMKDMMSNTNNVMAKVSIVTIIHNIKSVDVISKSYRRRTGFEWNLPNTIQVTLDNNKEVSMNVTWNTNDIDVTQLNTYNVEGVFSLPPNITNTDNIIPVCEVTIRENDKNIVSVSTINDITVDLNTSSNQLNLPTTNTVTLFDNSTAVLDINWNYDNYDGTNLGTYTLTGNLVLKDRIENFDNVVVACDVIVTNVVKQIVSAEQLEKTYSRNSTINFNLPNNVNATLSNGSVKTIPVTWNTDTVNTLVVGEYIVNGTFGTLPEYVANDNNIVPTYKVIIEENALNIKSINTINDISVTLNTNFNDIELPSTVNVMLYNNSTVSVPVTWNGTTYNGSAVGANTITGVLNPKDDIVNLDNLTPTCTINVVRAINNIVSIDPLFKTLQRNTTLDLDLPSTVTAKLNDNSTADVQISWNNTSIDTTKLGDSVITGTPINLSEYITNNNNIVANMTITLVENDKNIKSINALNDINVDINTNFEDIELPSTVTAILHDNTTTTLNVTWDGTNYDDSVGEYTIGGTITSNVLNFDNIQPICKIVVSEFDHEIDSIDDIEQTYQRASSIEWNLPNTVTVNLDNNDVKEVSVVWNTSNLDSLKLGTQTISGTLDNLPEHVLNSNNLTAQCDIIIVENNKNIVSAKADDVIVSVNTAFENINLPNSITVALYDGTMQNVSVTWNSEGYISNELGTYTIYGDIVTTNDVFNFNDVKASCSIQTVAKNIVSCETISKTYERAHVQWSEFPSQVSVTLNDNTTENIDVEWNYNVNTNQIGNVVVTGTLINLPNYITNTNNITAQCDLTLTEYSKNIVSVAPIRANVELGIESYDVDLPNNVTVTLYDNTTTKLSVSSWNFSDYDKNTPGTYTAVGDINLSSYEGANIANYNMLKAIATITVSAYTITSVESVTKTYERNEIINWNLPNTLNATLGNNSTVEVGVTWNTSLLDPTQLGTFEVSGTLKDIPNTADNKNNVQAKATIVINENAKTIVGTSTLNAIDVTIGTPFENVSLPSQIQVILNDSTTDTVDVTWDSTGYDSSNTGTYNAIGTLNVLTGSGIYNFKNIKATRTINFVTRNISSIASVSKTYERNTTLDWNLPTTVQVTLDDNTTSNVEVMWNTSDVTTTEIGTYNIEGTLNNLPNYITNTNNLKATGNITITENSKNIKTVETVNDIEVATNVEFSDVPLPSTINVTLEDNSNVALPVVWTSDSYDKNTEGTYSCIGTITNNNTTNFNNLTVSCNVIVAVYNIVSSESISQTYERNTTINWNLPSTVVTNLDNNSTKSLEVSWNTSNVNTLQIGNVVISGDFVNLPANVTNTSDVNALANITITENFKNVVSIDTTVPNKEVDYGTLLVDVGLPTNVTVTLYNGTTSTLPISWDDSNYSATTPGNYTVVGTLLTDNTNITNFNNVSTSCVITVKTQAETPDMFEWSHTFVIPYGASEISNFTEQLGETITEEDWYGLYDENIDDFDTTKRTVEMRYLGATLQNPGSDTIALDDAIDESKIVKTGITDTYGPEGLRMPVGNDDTEVMDEFDAKVKAASEQSNRSADIIEDSGTLTFDQKVTANQRYLIRKIKTGYIV